MGNDAAEVPPGRARGLRLLAVAVAIAVVDQLTKVWAVAALSDGPIRLVGDTVALSLTRNPGGAFGTFTGLTPILAGAAIIVAVVLVRAVHRTSDGWMLAGLVLVLGGALGNLVDRLARSPGFLRGEVVDFVKVGDFPVFNVADSAITVGVAILVVRSFRA